MLKIYVSVLRDNVLDGAQTIIRNIETWEVITFHLHSLSMKKERRFNHSILKQIFF